MLRILKLLFNVFTEVLLDKLPTSGVFGHVALNIINDAFEYDDLVVVLITPIELKDLSLR